MSDRIVSAANDLMIYLLKEDYQLLIANSESNVFRPSKTSIDMFFNDDYTVDIAKLTIYIIPNIVRHYDYFYRNGIEEIQIDMTGVIIDDRH